MTHSGHVFVVTFEYSSRLVKLEVKLKRVITATADEIAAAAPYGNK